MKTCSRSDLSLFKILVKRLAGYVSSDGLCYFEIGIDLVDADIASELDFKDAAYNLIKKCHPDTGTLDGGIASGIGRNGHLNLVMKGDHPSVHCSEPLGPLPQHCQDIADNMMADPSQQLFHYGPGPGMQLPVALYSSFF
ncbi:MAG: hypothetical protein Q9191_006406, partial [Dirinaria sp. TL-2023a]